jgi:4-hydroxybenzoate polyprenyltransferase
VLRLLDALVFSSLWVAAAAGALSAAVCAALGVPAAGPAVGIAFGGTLAVYSLDRLRDVARDRASAPARTAFVARHRVVLSGLGAAGGALGAACALLAGPRAWLPLAAALPFALAHRRLKTLWRAKALYVTASWLLVVVGVPALLSGGQGASDPAAPLHAATVVGLAIFANAIASNVRDDEAGAAVLGRGPALAAARWCAAGSIAAALLAPAPVRALGAVGAATLAALAAFRPTERYGLAVVDGALLLGALGTLLTCALFGGELSG